MIRPEVDPQDVADIKDIISDLFVRRPQSPSGATKQQVVFSSEECDALVGTVLQELGARGYAVMKPEPE